jgi:hypothetical protein
MESIRIDILIVQQIRGTSHSLKLTGDKVSRARKTIVLRSFLSKSIVF